MKVLFLTQTGPEGASARYRVYAYLPHLAKAGIEAEVWPLHAHAVGNPFSKISSYSRQFLQRWNEAGRAENFDAIVFQRDLINHLAPVLEKRFARTGIPLVLDVDDAIHLRPPDKPAGALAGLFGTKDKFADLVPLVQRVLVGNEELVRVAMQRGAKRVFLLPTAIDFSRIGNLPHTREPGKQFVLGWIGSPGTLSYLETIRETLEDLGRTGNYLLRIVGAPALRFANLPCESLPWSEKTEWDQIRSFDAGLMPLTDDPWSRCKCGTKLLQYLACGVPSVGSPVGANVPILDRGKAGILATTKAEWTGAFEALRTDRSLRLRLREAGRAHVEERYNVEKLAPALIEELKAAAATR